MSRDWRRAPWELYYARGASWASTLRRWQIGLTHLHCTVEFDGPVYLGPGFSLDIPGDGTFEVGSGAAFRRDFHCEIDGTGRVSIGAGTQFTAMSLIHCSTTIEIGKRCEIGQATLIVNGHHLYADPTRHFLEQGYNLRTVKIGDEVTIGAKCTAMADIGERAIIAPNSAVTRDIPPYCVARGAPARVIDYFGPPELRPAELKA